MSNLDTLDALFVITAFVFQVVLIVHFSFRKWRFDVVMRYGWIVYALSIPAAVISLILLRGSKVWYMWLGGFIYLVWAAFGYWVEFVRKIEWRNARRWSVLTPYVFMYVATNMFYWWPLIQLQASLFYIYTVLYVISMILNFSSHQVSSS